MMLPKLLIPLCFILHVGRNANVNEFRFDFTDCVSGDGGITNIALSVTPYPALFVNTLPVISIGGKLSFTERAQQLVNNISYEHFQNDFRQFLFVDNSTLEIPTWTVERLLNPRNNISACGSILDQKCLLIYEAMTIAKQDIPIFVITDFSSTTGNQMVTEMLSWLLRGIRIATSAGMSNWSDTFPVKKSGFPWLIVIAASCGAFIIAAITGSLGWLYYHRRKIEPLKDIQETLHGLEHRTNPHRQSIREPSTIDFTRTLPALPTMETNKDSYCATPYEPSPLQSPTPRSVVNFDASISDHCKPTNSDIQSIQYVDAELRT